MTEPFRPPYSDVTSRELAIIQQFLDERLKRIEESSRDHRDEDEERFSAVHRALYDEKNGLFYRLHSMERSIKMMCGFLRWSGGIIAAVIIGLIFWVSSEMLTMWKTHEAVKRLLMTQPQQSTQEPARK